MRVAEEPTVLLLPPVPVTVRVSSVRFTVPPVAFSRVMVSLPPVESVPLVTLAVAPVARRPPEPKFKVPPPTLTVVASTDPFSDVVPLFALTVPAPKLAFTVPPDKP